MKQQLDESAGLSSEISDQESNKQQNAKLASTEPNLDFNVTGNSIVINYQNLTKCTINYFQMDVELLFSTSPFVQQKLGQFGFIKPNKVCSKCVQIEYKIGIEIENSQ